MFKEAIAFVKKHWLMILCSIAILGAAHYFVGCESTTKSLLFDNKKVTRTELLSEIDMWLATADVRISELDRADAIRNFLLKQASTISEGGTVNPTATIVQLLSLLATGSIAYNAGQKKANGKSRPVEPERTR